MPDAQTPLSQTRVIVTVILCFLVAVLEGFDLQVIGLAAPALRAALGLSPEQLGWAFSGSLIGLAIGAMGGGWLADRVGRKPVLIGSVIGLGVFTLLTTQATDFTTLFAVRVAAGLALGGAMPNFIAVVSEVSPTRQITRLVALTSAGMPLGGILVGLTARFVMEDHGWHSLFWIGGILPLLIAPLLWIGLPETGRKGAQAAAARVPIGRTLFGKGQAAPTLLLWFVFIITLLLLSLLLNWTPSLIIARGFEPSQAITASIVLNLGSVAGSVIIGWMCDRMGVRAPMIAVYIGMAVALYLLSIAPSVLLLMVCAFFAGFFVLGAQFALYGVSPRLYEPRERAAGVGAALAVGRLGAILGPLVAGTLIGAGATGQQVVLVLAPLALVAGVAAVALAASAGDRLKAQLRGPAAH